VNYWRKDRSSKCS